MSVAYNIDDGEWFKPLPTNVLIGARSYLYSSYAFKHCASERECAVRIGSDTSIYAETSFDLGPEGEVTVGDYCSLGAPIFSTNGRISIGNHCYLADQGVVLADTFYAVPPKSRAVVRNETETGSEGEIVLADNVWVATRAVLLNGARIGEGSVVGAGAVVDFEVPPRSLVAGNPAQVIGPIRRRPTHTRAVRRPPVRSGSDQPR